MVKDGNTYYIVNLITQLALTLSGDSKSIVGYPLDYADNQKVRPTVTPSISPPPSDPDPPPQWTARLGEDGYWTLENDTKKRFLSFMGDPKPGDKIIGTGDPRSWRLDNAVTGPGSTT